MINYIGVTSHATAEGMKRAAELYDLDAMMISLNYVAETDWINVSNQEFEELALPSAAEKGIAMIAMKTLRPLEKVSGLSPEQLIRYVLSYKDFTTANISMRSQGGGRQEP